MRKGRAIISSAIIALTAAGSIAIVTVPAASATSVAAASSNGISYHS
jgi:hypothetical protein